MCRLFVENNTRIQTTHMCGQAPSCLFRWNFCWISMHTCVCALICVSFTKQSSSSIDIARDCLRKELRIRARPHDIGAPSTEEYRVFMFSSKVIVLFDICVDRFPRFGWLSWWHPQVDRVVWWMLASWVFRWPTWHHHYIAVCISDIYKATFLVVLVNWSLWWLSVQLYTWPHQTLTFKLGLSGWISWTCWFIVVHWFSSPLSPPCPCTTLFSWWVVSVGKWTWWDTRRMLSWIELVK
jgi:hypothetical protein